MMPLFSMGKQASNPAASASDHPPWLDLPTPLAELILERLVVPDRMCFASVCSTWRSIQRDYCLRHPLPPMFPLPSLGAPSKPQGRNVMVCYSPFEEKFCSIQVPSARGGQIYASVDGWLVLVQGGHPSSVSILKPTSSVEVHLPPISSTPLSASMSSPPDVTDSALMLSTGSEILLWHAKDPMNLTRLRHPNYMLVTASASIFCRGKFYCACSKGELYVIDPLPSPTITLLDMEWSEMPHSPKWDFLVESGGDVLLVRAAFEDDVNRERAVTGFRVFRADLSARVWVGVDDLGDRALFLGKTCSVSLPAARAGCGESCIYFPRHLLPRRRVRSSREHLILWKIFDVRNEKVTDGSSVPSTREDLNYSEFRHLTVQWIML